jgi:tetratricopeptide (TPR) repeat protein
MWTTGCAPTRGQRVRKYRVALLCLSASLGLAAQTNQSSGASDLRQHYEAAQDAQAAGDLSRADLEYRQFLAQALHRLADHRAGAGDFSKAAVFLQQALTLTPLDAALRIDCAEACRLAGEFAEAKSVIQPLLSAKPESARVHFILGRILLQSGELQDAERQLEASVRLDPTFEHGYALATVYLKMKAPDRAATIFREMQAGLGNTAPLHMEAGRAYAEAGYPERAIPEFEKAISLDDNLSGVHYSLGAACLLGLGDAAFDEAASEFNQELRHHPDDVLSLSQLGYIALNQHKLDEAEKHLDRAARLDPKNPDLYLYLGQLYVEQNRRAEAEAALRKSIELTTNVQRNHYQVQRAHYLLGRLLLQSGRTPEGQQELTRSQELLRQSVAENQGETSGGMLNDPGKRALFARVESSPQDSSFAEVEAYERQLTPALADSYNNLGSLSAEHGDFSAALAYFQQAAIWDPALEGLDANWGRAAFTARKYNEAVVPLARTLQNNPTDAWTRSALGSTYFNLNRYSEAAEVLQPLENQVGALPRLNYIYALALIRSGKVEDGLKRLQDLQRQIPRLADLHAALGEAWAMRGEHTKAVSEYNNALDLNPADVSTEYRLAVSLIALGRKPEAQSVLARLAAQGTTDAGVYYELGRLQLEQGDLKRAIASLETGARIDPDNSAIHYELATAYRRSSRDQDAERELKRYEETHKKQLTPPN